MPFFVKKKIRDKDTSKSAIDTNNTHHISFQNSKIQLN